MKNNKENKELDLGAYESKQTEIKTGWNNPPELTDLKQDLSDAKQSKDDHVNNVNKWLDILNAEGASKPECGENRSTIQPKTTKKNNEWRYPSLTEPFLSTRDVFNVSPYTFEDGEAARQNGLVLNNQFNTKINKTDFIDEYIRTAVDEGTVFVRVGWERTEEKEEIEVPVYEIYDAESEEEVAQLQQMNEMAQNGEDVGDEWIAAIKLSEANQSPMVPIEIDVDLVEEVTVVKNNPTVEVVDFNNLVVDPSCNGDLTKAKFAIFSFETSKSELEALDLYKNLDKINLAATSTLNVSDDEYESNEDTDFNFKDEPRKKFVAHEYWGYWDIDGSGRVKPIVATWVGDVLIRLEENPYPDKQLPFVSAQYLPVRKSLYGEPDAVLLEDNQKIIGAVMRGLIDSMARAANGQRGYSKDLLDGLNRIKFEKGEDYEFNPNNHPNNGIVTHTFDEMSSSPQFMLQLAQAESEAMTGVRPYGPTATGNLTASATQSRGALDAASKREVAILRRLSDGIKKIGQKIISMNQEFLEDEEIVRITNQDFVAIKREDLAGKFDLVLDISTAEEDNSKAQEIAFMLQTIGPNIDPMITNKLMADVLELRKMPEAAEELRNTKPPEPNPIEVAQAEAALALAQAEASKAQAEVAKIQLEMKKLESEVLLNQQRAGVQNATIANVKADTDNKNLDYVETETGIKHNRNLEQQGAQAKANIERDIINQDLKNKSETDKSVRDLLLKHAGSNAQRPNPTSTALVDSLGTPNAPEQEFVAPDAIEPETNNNVLGDDLDSLEI